MPKNDTAYRYSVRRGQPAVRLPWVSEYHLEVPSEYALHALNFTAVETTRACIILATIHWCGPGSVWANCAMFRTC